MRRYFAFRLFRYNLPLSLMAILFLFLATGRDMQPEPGRSAAALLLAWVMTKLAFILPSAGFALSWLQYGRSRRHEFPLYFNLGISRRQLALSAWGLALLAGATAFILGQGGVLLWPA